MLERITCSCGQCLVIEPSIADQLLTCSRCGRHHPSPAAQPRVPSSESTAESLGLSKRETDKENRRLIPVVGGILAVLMLLLALVWALMAYDGSHGAGGMLADGGSGSGTAGNGPGSGTSGTGPGSGAKGLGPGSGHATNGAGSAATSRQGEGEPTDDKPEYPTTQESHTETAVPPQKEEPPEPTVEPDRPKEKQREKPKAKRPRKSPTTRPEATVFRNEEESSSKSAPSSPSTKQEGDEGASGTTGKTGSIFEHKGTATKYVFVLDRSGSMAENGKLDHVKAELMKMLAKLTTKNSFFVIFFSEGHTAMPSMPANQLVAATSSSRKMVYQWLSGVQPEGGTDPTSAMQLALSLKPEVIWLLTDGMLQFPEQTCQAIQQANPTKQVSINTIAFHNREGEEILKRIAQENRGEYKFIRGPNTPPAYPRPSILGRPLPPGSRPFPPSPPYRKPVVPPKQRKP